MSIVLYILWTILVVGFVLLAITAPPYSPFKRFVARLRGQKPTPAPVRQESPPDSRRKASPVGEAFWLTICCVNLFFFTRYAFEATGGWQAFWGVMCGMWIRLTYTSIRRATRGDV